MKMKIDYGWAMDFEESHFVPDVYGPRIVIAVPFHCSSPHSSIQREIKERTYFFLIHRNRRQAPLSH